MLSYFSIEDRLLNEFVSFQKERFIQLFVIYNMLNISFKHVQSASNYDSISI